MTITFPLSLNMTDINLVIKFSTLMEISSYFVIKIEVKMFVINPSREKVMV